MSSASSPSAGRALRGIQPLVQFAEEVMKMDPPFGGERQAGEKVVEIKLFLARYVPRRTPLRPACRGHQLLTEGVKAR